MVAHRTQSDAECDGDTESNDSHTREDAEKDLLNRRSYLQLAGVAAATVTGPALARGDASASNPETIAIPPGTTRTFQVGEGETFQNVLFDCTEPGAVARLRTSGSSWTVRNVGWKGEFTAGMAPLCVPRVDSQSGHGLVENVYFGDGLATDGAESSAGAVRVGSGHVGTLTLRNVCVRDGGIAAGDGRSDGDTHVVESYVENAGIAGFRTGGDNSSIRDSVVDLIGGNQTHERACGICLTDGGEVLVENCDVGVGSTDGASVIASGGVDAHVKDSRVAGGPLVAGRDATITRENVSGGPDLTPPDGVPTSATAAASGGVTGASLDRTMVIEGTGESMATMYSLAVTEGLERSSADAAPVSGRSVSDSLHDAETAGYRFSGTIRSFSYDGVAAVYVDGHEVDPAELGRTEHTLVVEGADEDATTTYSLSVTGDLVQSGKLGAADDTDEVSGSSADGSVRGTDADGYWFTGGISSFSHDGDASVYVDGEEVDPSTL